MSGESLRDEGIERVRRGTPPMWHAMYTSLAAKLFLSLPVGATFSGEDLRLHALAEGLPEPHHPNVWGAAASGYIRAVLHCKMAEPGGTAKATSAKSHAHHYRVYRKIAA